MSFTDYYYKLGYETGLKKTSGFFRDDKGDLTLASKLGIGALGAGALGLGAHHLMDSGVVDSTGSGMEIPLPPNMDPGMEMPEPSWLERYRNFIDPHGPALRGIRNMEA